MGIGDQIASDHIVDLSSLMQVGIRPWFSNLPSPPLNNNPHSTQSPGQVNNDWGGALESVTYLPLEGYYGPPWYQTEYTFVFGGMGSVYAVGMSPFMDQVVSLMQHPQLGDRFAGLMAQYWPTTWGLLQAGTYGQGVGLFRVRTHGLYWVSGWKWNTTSLEVLEAEMADARELNGKCFLELCGFPGNMPGIEYLEEKSQTFKGEVDTANAVLGVIGKAVGIVAAVASIFGGGN